MEQGRGEVVPPDYSTFSIQILTLLIKLYLNLNCLNLSNVFGIAALIFGKNLMYALIYLHNITCVLYRKITACKDQLTDLCKSI